MPLNQTGLLSKFESLLKSLNLGLFTALFSSLMILAHIVYDYSENRQFDFPYQWILLCLNLTVLGLYKKSAFRSPVIAFIFWSGINFIQTIFWGKNLGFDQLGVIIFVCSLLLTMADDKIKIKWILIFQAILISIAQFTVNHSEPFIGFDQHKSLYGFNLYGAILFVMIFSASIFQRVIEHQVQTKRDKATLEAILQTLPAAVFGKTISKNYEWSIWNHASEELFGLKAKDCIGKNDYDFFPKVQADFFRQKDIEASRADGVIDIPEEKANTPQGEVILHTRKTVIKNEFGQPEILLGITSNITEQKNYEKEILNKKIQLKQITENLPGLISQVDEQGRYIFANVNYKKWIGVDPEWMIGKTHKDVLPPHLYEKAKPFIQRALNGETVSFDGEGKRPDGSPQHGRTTFVPNVDESGKNVGFFSLVFDITEIKLAQAQLIQNSKLASLGELSAGIAHEINNPLAIVQGALKVLSSKCDNPKEVKKHVETIQRASERIGKIVLGLKRFSRTSDSSERSSVSLNKIITESISLMAPQFKKFNTAIQFEFDIDLMINCNEIEIEQVFVNLISNALYVVKDLPDKWIKISLKTELDWAVARVTDSGHGISADFADKIFQPFLTTKPVGEGTGLGLSISKGIVEDHRGKIKVVAGEKNTCFEIRFPIDSSLKHVA